MATSRRTARTCRRPGCARSATATLLLSYVDASVRIQALHDEPHPAHWDMCGEHADRLGVPRGWNREDQRERVEPAAETAPVAHGDPDDDPLARPRAPADQVPPYRASARRGSAESPASPAGQRRPANRYAVLTACLPQIAASLAAALDPDLGPLPPDIPGQLSLPVADAAEGSASAGDDADAVPVEAAAGSLGGTPTPDNVVPLVRRGVLDPIG